MKKFNNSANANVYLCIDNDDQGPVGNLRWFVPSIIDYCDQVTAPGKFLLNLIDSVTW